MKRKLSAAVQPDLFQAVSGAPSASHGRREISGRCLSDILHSAGDGVFKGDTVGRVRVSRERPEQIG